MLYELKEHRDQINNAAAITPFVIVPRENFNHFTVHHGAEGIKDLKVGVVNNIN
jgi:hypothetical protein